MVTLAPSPLPPTCYSVCAPAVPARGSRKAAPNWELRASLSYLATHPEIGAVRPKLPRVRAGGLGWYVGTTCADGATKGNRAGDPGNMRGWRLPPCWGRARALTPSWHHAARRLDTGRARPDNREGTYYSAALEAAGAR